LVGQIGIRRKAWFLVQPGLAQMFAIQRAVNTHLPFRAAALRAYLAPYARTMPSRAPFLADFAGNIHRRLTPLSYHRDMARTDLYLKVELDLNEKETPERLASEICRLIRKIYGVRAAEVSSIIERDA